jgi:hypothetical protein
LMEQFKDAIPIAPQEPDANAFRLMHLSRSDTALVRLSQIGLDSARSSVS